MKNEERDKDQEDILGRSWWYRPVTPTLRRLGQEFEVILCYTAKCCLKNLKVHYGCENANNIQSEKEPEVLMADWRQQIERGSSEITE